VLLFADLAVVVHASA